MPGSLGILLLLLDSGSRAGSPLHTLCHRVSDKLAVDSAAVGQQSYVSHIELLCAGSGCGPLVGRWMCRTAINAANSVPEVRM